jgi:hypothetical protein
MTGFVSPSMKTTHTYCYRGYEIVPTRVRIGEDIGSGWIDKTDDAIERAKGRLSQLKELLTEEGKTTVIKPDAL